MSTDSRTVKTYKRHQHNAHAAAKTYWRRKDRRADSQHGEAEIFDSQDDHETCTGLGCCLGCDWDEPWWPLESHEAVVYFTDGYLRPERLVGYASKYAKSWRPKIVDIMVDDTVHARHLGDGFGGARVYGTSTRGWLTLLNKLSAY